LFGVVAPCALLPFPFQARKPASNVFAILPWPEKNFFRKRGAAGTEHALLAGAASVSIRCGLEPALPASMERNIFYFIKKDGNFFEKSGASSVEPQVPCDSRTLVRLAAPSGIARHLISMTKVMEKKCIHAEQA
jgi:hypothetical protein